MTLKQRIFKSKVFIFMAAYLMALYIRFIYQTNKWEKKNFEILEQFKNKPFIFSFWHGRLMMMAMPAPKWMKINVLSSNHPDGILVSKINENLGIKTIKGSSSKGGAFAIRGIIKVVKNNETVAITPDGPRGPARKVNGNIVDLAKKLDIPILPVTFSCNKHKLAKSWDKFMVAKPFGKGVFILGNPVSPESNGELEQIMNDLTDEADRVAKSL